jgi:hypothetical protein
VSTSWAAHGGPPAEAFGPDLPRSPNTPGIGGYLLAVAVAFAWNALFLAGTAAGLGGFVVGWIAVYLYSLWFGLPIALAGVLVVHLLCCRVRAQWVHVAVAALSGFVLTALLFGSLSGDPMTLLALSVGVAAGLGRVAVVPAVHRRRERLASRPSLRVP